jgi:acetolactate synthase-1/2/3 large subunit
MEVSQILLNYMKGEGVEYFFGIPGGHIGSFFDALYDVAPDVKTILPKHEQGAGFMASGYYMANHKIAACGATVGPGGMNLAAGLHVAYQNSVPVLAITSNVARRQFGRSGIQDSSGWGPRSLCHVGVFSEVTKWSVLLFDSERAEEVIRRAFRVMLSGRKGPAHIDVPMDIFKEEVSIEKIWKPNEYRSMGRIRGDINLIKKAVDMLIEAQSPVILSGGGVISSHASPELIEFAELLSIPVATTLMGKSSFPEDHPLAVGVTGRDGHDTANRVVRTEKSDVLLAIGCMFHQGTTNSWISNFGGKNIIHIDIDPSEIGRNYPLSLGIWGDGQAVLRDLITVIKSKLANLSAKRLKEIEEKKRDRIEKNLKLKDELSYYQEHEMFSEAVPLMPQRACREIRDAAPKDAIIWTDCGNNLAWAERYIQSIGPPRTFLADGGHTHMGFSVAASIGAKLACPNRDVISILGDASFQMMGKEITTAAAYDIPVVWCILNDGNLGMIKQGQKMARSSSVPERYIATSSFNPNFVKLAEACHCQGFLAEKPGEVKEAVKNALDSHKPTVIDIRINPDIFPPMRVKAYKNVTLKYPYLRTKKMPVPKWPRPYDEPL